MINTFKALIIAALVLLALTPALAQEEESSAVRLDVNASDFPDASLMDFRYLHDRPTGVHGNLFVGTDGRFYFQDGMRARFWGINIAKDSVFISRPLIDRAIETIDRAGYNLVRFHHFDDVQGLLPPPTDGTVGRFDESRLEQLDYWIAELGKRGIYVYLDLLDYRTFYEQEEVRAAAGLGRGAKPYALFDQRLIVLQQQYARKLLLDHTNPYTGLSYAKDPTVCLLELFDENGFFSTARKWPELISPYKEELQERWNVWLKDKYGDTKTLREAWTDADGNVGLKNGENLEQTSVALFPPAVRVGAPPGAKLHPDPEDGQVGRVSDRRLFLCALHEDYFKAMRDYLRSHGVQQPITAVGDFTHPTDLRALASQLDFIGMNFYYDHPLWAKGNDWKLPAYFENIDPISDPRVESFVPRVCSSRVAGKPLVIREWNVCWPNKFRACGMLEAAVYGALQDLDALILFTYDIRPGLRRLEFFDVHSDPARWGMSGQCASIFLGRTVSPARRKVGIGYSTVDSTYPTFQPYPTEVYKLGWVSQVSNYYFDQQAEPGRLDLLLASGRTNGAVYPGGHSIILGNWPARDLLNHQRDKTVDIASGYEVATVPEKTQDFVFGGTMFDKGERHRFSPSPGYLLADVQHNDNLRPIGISADGEVALGFRDMKRQNWVFRQLNATYQLRVALDALGQLYNDPVSHTFVDTNRYTSDTGQVSRLVDAELLLIDAPLVQGISGSLQNGDLTKTSALSLTSQSPLGALVWTSFDGRPAATSQHWVLKMVTTATNTGEEKGLHLNTAEKTLFALSEMGTPPITTLGANSDQPTTVSLNGKVLVQLYLTGGTWELLFDEGAYYLHCDTPGTRISLPRLPNTVSLTTFDADDQTQTVQSAQPFLFPKDARMILVK